MALINRGACVGVLYQTKNGDIKVHNGKITTAVDSNNLPSTFRIVHVGNPKTMKQEILTFSDNGPLYPLAVQKTPDISPAQCRNLSRISGYIESGACIAVRFPTGNPSKPVDVKNGRLLYAVDKSGKVLCRVPTDPTKLKSIQKVVYEHMNIVTKQGVPSFVPQTRERTGVTAIVRVTL